MLASVVGRVTILPHLGGVTEVINTGCSGLKRGDEIIVKVGVFIEIESAVVLKIIKSGRR